MKYWISLFVLISLSAYAQDKKPALPRKISQACKVDTDCIVAYDQCGRCYSINKKEKAHLEGIFFRACSIPSEKMRTQCSLTQAKCKNQMCQ